MSTEDGYRIVAKFYDGIIEPMQAGVRDIALGVLPPRQEWQVLDVGCGTGTGLALYAEAGCTVVGVDVSAAMLEQARSRLGTGAALHHTDGGVLPFDDGRFDLVTTSMVIHEVAAETREAFITEMARVTKPEGRILLVDFRFGELRGWKGPIFRALSGSIERLSGHYSGYRSFKADGGIPGLLEKVGLTVEREKVVSGGNISISVVYPELSP